MSDAAASSQSGEKPNAAIELSSTTLPAVLRFSSSPGLGSPAGDSRSTFPTSSIAIRSMFLAVASYSRERRANRGSTTSAVSCTAPPSAATSARSARSGNEARKDRSRRTATMIPWS